MKKYGYTGKIKAKEGKGEQLAAILLQASAGMSKVKGCRTYIVCLEETDKDTISVFEVWDTKEDHDQSLTLPEVRELIGKAMPLIEGKPQGTALDVLGGLGAE